MSSHPLGRLDYTVGWISALPVELAAAKALLDEQHPPLPRLQGDTNSYVLGRIEQHNIVMACLPTGDIGTSSAASVASKLLCSFPAVKFGLMVGIGGGVPGTEDIRLGDVVIGVPERQNRGAIQYDFGKTEAKGKFRHTGSLNGPPELLLKAVTQFRASSYYGDQLTNNLAEIYQKLQSNFAYPGAQFDLLFDASYDHVDASSTCEHCDVDRILKRPSRNTSQPCIHYGTIASGNQVMRHGTTRDQLREEHGVLCFEMEAAGLMNTFPCLVIRGISDYADSHKNDLWKEYAAATASAYAKKLLSFMPPESVEGLPGLESPMEVTNQSARSGTYSLFDSETLTSVQAKNGDCDLINSPSFSTKPGLSADLRIHYADSMRHHPYGYALYHPCKTTTIKPGFCGYFNNLGDWNPITDVTKDGQPFERVDEELQKGDTQSLVWGPKCSQDVTEHRFTMKDKSLPGVPQDIKLFCRYRSSSAFGAVLLTTPPITKESYYHYMPFVKWFRKNAKVILARYPEVRDHDVWIVTSTCSTSECALNAWTTKDKEVVVGFSRTASLISDLDSKGKWYPASDDGGWNHLRKQDEEFVVFIGGLRFRYNRKMAIANIVRSEKDKKAPFKRVLRGDGDDLVDLPITDFEEDGEMFTVSCERWDDIGEPAEEEDTW